MSDYRIIAIGLGLSMIVVGAALGWGVKVFTEPCNIQVLYINGIVTASPPEMLTDGVAPLASPMFTTSQGADVFMEQLQQSPFIDGAIIAIDSPGGSALAGEEFAGAFARFDKPIVSVIRSSGTSAAYWSALGTDRIFASANSQVGSIGAVFSYTDTSKKNEKEGITYNVVSSGKFKDLGNPNRPLTEEEQELLERDVKIMEQNFIDAVSRARSLAPEVVKQMADGSFMLGAMAKEKGLIDEIGGFEEARLHLESKLGRAKLCE